MGSISMYVLERRADPDLMDEKDIERLERAEEKRKRRAAKKQKAA